MDEKTFSRFLNKIEFTSSCWLWKAYIDKDGYGRFEYGKQVHRIAYEWWVESIPEGLELDPLCRHRECVNPEHLEPVTHLENVQRGNSGVVQKEKIYCPQNHMYSEENTYRYVGSRFCKECDRITSRERYWKKKGVLV